LSLAVKVVDFYNHFKINLFDLYAFINLTCYALSFVACYLMTV